MKVEIWSDVMCPFCYIGKKKFEQALNAFPSKHQIEIEWKSFQLNPNLETQPSKSVTEYLAEEKGWTIEYAQEMNDYVQDMAKEVGLNYQLDKAIVANSLDAHRLSHLAKKHGVQNDLEELLFKAYFEEGKNTADHQFLVELGAKVNIPEEEIKEMLSSDKYVQEVRRDIYESGQVGVRGVPFFVFDRKYAISGAQQVEAFSQTLEKAFGEWISNESSISVEHEGGTCTTEGTCD